MGEWKGLTRSNGLLLIKGKFKVDGEENSLIVRVTDLKKKLVRGGVAPGWLIAGDISNPA